VLVDGQLVDPVPVAACREMGADKVIAVDINPPSPTFAGKSWKKVNIMDVLVGTLSIFNWEITRRAFAENSPDVLIRPSVGDVWALDFRHADRLVEIGRKAVGDDLAINQ
jgi:NTE family protein